MRCVRPRRPRLGRRGRERMVYRRKTRPLSGNGARVDRRRGVAAFREPANRLVRRIGVVDPRVEHESGIERVPLSVQRVTRVLDERGEILRQFSTLVALVSPVSSKKNSLNPSPGLKTPFSGRLNGVAWRLWPGRSRGTARAVDGGVVDRHPAGFERLAVGVQGELVGAVQRFLARRGDRFAAFSTCSACSLPFWRSPGCAGT